MPCLLFCGYDFIKAFLVLCYSCLTLKLISFWVEDQLTHVAMEMMTETVSIWDVQQNLGKHVEDIECKQGYKVQIFEQVGVTFMLKMR